MWLISLQKSAAVHVARHCPSTRTERIFMDWLWWILQGLPFTHLVSFWDFTADSNSGADLLLKHPNTENPE
jgi:hypothetical protein